MIEGSEAVENMVAGLGDGIASRAHRLYAWAKKNDWTQGVPSGNFYTPAETGEAEVMSVLQTIEGNGVTIDLEYLHYGNPNSLHYGWVHLVQDYGYDSVTNQIGSLSALKGAPVFLEDMVVVVPLAAVETIDVATLAQWGISPRAGATPERQALTGGAAALMGHSPVEKVSVGMQEQIKVTYVWGAPGALQRESLMFPVTGLSDRAKFFHAAYTADGVRKFFFYEDGEGTYSALDQVFDAPPTPNGSFFPFIYFRFNKVSELFDKTTDSYRANHRMMSILGMDYDQVAEAINANPDITDVEQAMLMFAVPANTTNKIERRYLWDFFNNLFLVQDPNWQTRPEYQFETSSFFMGLIQQITGFQVRGIAVQDRRFKLWLDNSGIYKRRIAGKLGRIGTYDSGYQRESKQIEVLDQATGQMVTVTTPADYHYFRRQVSSGFYDELQVIDLRTVFNIYSGYNSIGDDDGPILLIPLDQAITKRYSMAKREQLYSRAMHYVFNSRVTQKVKWYQTSVFRAVLIIVMVVVTFMTNGATAGELAALLQAGAYTAAAYLVVMKIVEAIIIRVLFKVLVRALGVKFALILAVVAALAGAVDAFDAGSIAGAPFAKDLLMLANGLSTGVQDKFKSDMDGLAREKAEFEKYTKTQEALLKDAEELLGEPTRLEPLVFFGETPSDYYSRTVHSGNIGVLSIDMVSSYVDTKLALPKLQETLGEQEDD